MLHCWGVVLLFMAYTSELDSAVFRSDSDKLLDELYPGLSEAEGSAVMAIGHPSGGGEDMYNEEVS